MYVLKILILQWHGFFSAMPRTYKRQPGARKYCDYPKEQLERCLASIRNGQMTQRKAEAEFNIPRRTIINKLKEHHINKPGQPQMFSDEEETSFVRCIIQFSEFGFPLTAFDLRMIVKTYLSKIGRFVKKFKNNIPGHEWALSFVKRHPELTTRFANNVKRSRAAINEATLTDYINSLSKVVEGVPSENIWNFDESNLTDNPGHKKVITKRGMKYPERICNSSKTSISIMFAGNAAGDLLPPYVVYGSSCLWNTWTENGPAGCRYNNSISGWFDSATFTTRLTVCYYLN